MATMNAAVLHGVRDLRFERRAIPRPGAGELLLRVEAVGVCGTDVAEWSVGPRIMAIGRHHPGLGLVGPTVPGHEFAGEVVAVGSGVDASWLGRRVASSGITTCGRCPHCTAGRSGLCPEYTVVGLHRDGALAEFVVTPVDATVPVDHLGLAPEEAVLTQPTAIALHAVRRSGVEPGGAATVIGVGGIGAFLVHVLQALGVTVEAIDLDPERMRIARTLGASPVRAVATRSRTVFEATGSAGGLRAAMERVDTGGTLVLVGVQKAPQSLDLTRIVLGEVDIVGSNSMSHPVDFVDAVELVALRAGGWDEIVAAPVGLGDVESHILEPMRLGRPSAIKSTVDPRIDTRYQR